MTQRSIGMMILLIIITFGIYGLYWYLKFQQELKDKTGEGFNWVGHLLLSIITFGIYSIYWQYAAGKRLARLGASDNSIIYLILCFVALSWLNPFLMQSQANKLV